MAHIPVSMVDDDWFERDFSPALRAALSARAGLWVVVEHADEGDFLLRRFRSELVGDVRELDLSPCDPLVGWMDVVGNGDTPGMFGQLGGTEALFIYGGAHVHHDFLASWARLLGALASSEGCAVVSAVHRRTLTDAPHLFDGSWSRFEVPSFGAGARDKRVALAAALLTRAGVPMPDAVLAESLLDKGPVSRTELEHWVEACAQSAAASADGAVDLAAVHRLRRKHSHPRPQRSRAQLDAEFQAIRTVLADTDRAHADWRGGSLFAPVRGPVEPFATHDPRGWFVSTVSYAACQYFDACDPILFRLSELVVEHGSLAFRYPPALLKELRALRTFFQHGLDWNSPKDVETRDTVVSWFRLHCGTDEPQRDHWRDLCGVFLAAWGTMARSMLQVTNEALRAPNREHIEAELDRAGTRLPEHVWQGVVSNAATTLGLPVDARAFVRVHLSMMMDALKRAAPHPGAIDAAARKIAEGQLLQAWNVRPVSGDDIVRAGYPPGPMVGKMLRVIEKLWDENPERTPAELIDLAARSVGPPQ